MIKKIFLLLFFFVCSLKYLSAQIITSGGGPSAFTIVNYPGNFVSYYDGFSVIFRSAQVCGASPSMDIASKGPKTIVNLIGGALIAGDIQTNQVVTLVFDAGNNNFRMISPSGNAGGGGGFILNGTGIQTAANFAIQSSAIGNVGGVIRGFAGQTADLQQWQNSAGMPVAFITAGGTMNVANSGSYQTYKAAESGGLGAGLTLQATGVGGHFYTIYSTNVADGTAGLLKFDDETVGQTRMMIDAGGSVGIGTTAPQAILNIAGAVPTPGSRPTSGIFFTTPNNTNVRGQIGLVQNSTEGNHYLLIQSVEETVAWRPIVFARDGGNVGIGTTNPNRKLSIAGQLNLGVSVPANQTNGQIAIKGDGIVTNHDIKITDDAAGANYKEVSLDYYYNAASPYFSIQALHNGIGYHNIALNSSGGKVGVGISTPDVQLHVKDITGAAGENIVLKLVNGRNVWVEEDGPGIAFHAQDGREFGRISARNLSGLGSEGYMVFSTRTSEIITERLRINNNGALAVNGASNYGSSGQVLTSNGNAPPTWVNPPGGIAGGGTLNFVPKFTPNGATLGNSGIFEDATGKVGIGTSTPSYPLQIEGNITDDLIRIQNKNNVSGSSIQYINDAGVFKGAIGYANSGIAPPYGSKLFISSGSGVPVAFFTDDAGSGGTQRMMIENGTGNVAIGAGAPNASALLDVSSASKGMLVPRVALTGSNDVVTISGPATSLLIYNTATAGASPNNVVPGYYYWDGAKWISMSGGSGGNDWSLLGNAGTVDATNFIGTTDNIPFNVRVNNTKSGRIDPTLYNTFWGYQSGNAGPSGSYNTASGGQSLFSLTTGWYNTATGMDALYNNIIGQYNTANGSNALFSNKAGSNATAIGANAMYYAYNDPGAFTNYNVAVGFEALRGSATPSSNTGNNNTALGYQTLLNNTKASDNVAVGKNALQANTNSGQNVAVGNDALTTQSYSNTGIAWVTDNVAVGYQALYTNNPTNAFSARQNTAVGSSAMYFNGTGDQNTAMGYRALYVNSTGFNNAAFGLEALFSNTGSENVGVGRYALRSNTNGTDNTAIGMGAGYTSNPANANTTGNYNVYIGYNSGAGVASASNLQNSIAIGKNALVNQSNSMVLGGTGGDGVFVGIGTPTPGVALDVVNLTYPNAPTIRSQGAGNPAVNITRTNGTGGTLDLAITDGSPAWFTGGITSGDAIIKYGPGKSLKIGNNSAGPPLVSIDAAGNVGIGTTAPSTLLHINSGAAGAIKIVDGTQLANRVLTSDATGVGTWVAAPSIVPGGALNYTMRHDGTNWVASSFLLNTGTQIGVGTSVIQNTIDVEGNMAIGTSFSGNNGAPANGLIVEGNAGFATALPLVKLDARATSAKGATAFENVFQVASSDAAAPLALRFGVQTHVTPGSRYGSIEVDDAATKRKLELQPNGGDVGIGSYNAAGGALTVNGPSASFSAQGSGYNFGISGTVLDASTLFVDGSVGANAAPGSNVMLALKDGHIQTQQTVTFVSGTFAVPGPDLTFSGNSGGGNASVTFTAGMGSTDVAGQFAYVPCSVGCAGFAAGAQVTITFKKPYVKPPIVILTPVNGNGNFFVKQVYVISTVNNFTLNYTVAPAAGQSVTVNYVVMEGN